MDEVKTRIDELERIKEGLHRLGITWSERWAMAELAEMKVVLKRNEKALAGTRA